MLLFTAFSLAISSFAEPPVTCPGDVGVPGVERAFLGVHGVEPGHVDVWAGSEDDLRLFLSGDREAGKRIEQGAAMLLKRKHAQLTRITYHDETETWTFVTLDLWNDAPFGAAPTGPAPADPGGLVSAWQEYEARGWALQRAGGVRPVKDCGALHCLFGFAHPELASYRSRFDEGVPGREEAIGEVLVRDPDPERRAAAAFLLGHSREPAVVVPLLLRGLTDGSSKVRNNVLRVSGQIASRDASFDPAPFLRALALPVVTDRNKALVALATLAVRDKAVARSILRAAPDEILASLALAQPNNRDAALEILRAASGRTDGSCDVDRWKRWVRACETLAWQDGCGD
ncbi:MAG: HEAT repeat domain-containing protein [Deltaproteobacteria bacterium]|nr:HEAT repeat domain-containing protein [Deltaproteobacteria bacterium]